MDDIDKAKEHYFSVAKGMGYIPDTDTALEFEYEADLVSHDGPTTQYPQIRVLSEMNDDAEVTVWTMVNSNCTVPKGNATLKAHTNRVEITWSGYSEDGSVNMSADLWKLKYRFKDVPGASCFDYVMVNVQQ